MNIYFLKTPYFPDYSHTFFHRSAGGATNTLERLICDIINTVLRVITLF